MAQCEDEYSGMGDWLVSDEQLGQQLEYLLEKCKDGDKVEFICVRPVQTYYPDMAKFATEEFIVNDVAPDLCSDFCKDKITTTPKPTTTSTTTINTAGSTSSPLSTTIDPSSSIDPTASTIIASTTTKAP